MSTHPSLAKDLTGHKFGLLTAVAYVGSKNGAIWSFNCDCGSHIEKRASIVVGGHCKSCGCLSRNARFSVSTLSPGQTIGLIQLMKCLGKRGHNIEWECKCGCGVTFKALASNLTSGNTKSCGCHKRAVNSVKNLTHGLSNSSINWIWQNMMRRCYDPKNEAYIHYGGRGILVCERWHTFENFLADMGRRPDGLTLDRIDVNGNYEPDNCRWATPKEQARNQRRNRHITIAGETRVLSEWAEISGISATLLWARKFRLGWKDDELLRPPRQLKRRT